MSWDDFWENIPTVPNNSYRFWAVLDLEGYVLNVADIHKYWSKMP